MAGNIAKIQRIYNWIDCLFDRQAITQNLHYSRPCADAQSPITARQALTLVFHDARKFDRTARLKSIISQPGVDQHGASPHWEFAFDLVKRRAKLTCEWILIWDETIDHWNTSKIDINVRPFPASDSHLRKLSKDGEILYRQLIGLWQEERNRLPDLPLQFRDSQEIVTDFKHQGLDLSLVEFSLHTGISPAFKPIWIAQTRERDYKCPF